MVDGWWYDTNYDGHKSSATKNGIVHTPDILLVAKIIVSEDCDKYPNRGTGEEEIF